MAMTALTIQEIEPTGIAPSFGAANVDGHSLANDGRVFVELKNSGTIKVATIDTPQTVGGLAVAQRTVSIPATTGDVIIGPFKPASLYNQADGTVHITFDAVAGLTVAAFRL